MTKQMNAATLAAMVFLGTLSMQAQLTTTTQTTKVAPGETKTTVVTKESKASGGSAKKSKKRTARKAEPKKHVETAIERHLRELQEKMDAQQAQIDALKQQNADKDAAVAAAQQAAQTAQTQAAAAATQAEGASSSSQENKDAVTKLNSTVTDLQTANTGLATTISANKQELNEKIESPTVLHYKGVTITPVAFFAFENVYRSRALNSDVNTPFNATPYPGAAQAHTSELNFSGRQSRIGGLFEGNTGPFKLSGYIEADFLSAGVTSNSNESNSYTLRQRQFFGQAATKSGFTVTGGQMWSLVTETKKSTDNRTENLPMTVDAQYHVGFSWARQPAIRFQQKSGPFTVAMSLEHAQIIFANPTNGSSNFFIGNAGTGGGLYNATANYSNNVAPDVIVKATLDPKVGHYEVGGIARWFRDRYYPGLLTAPTTGVAGAANDTKTGGGVFGNARFPVTKYADIGFHVVAGTGVGRYGTATLPDATAHPDGTLAPMKSYQGLYSMELHPNKKLDLFGYAGGEYAQRTVYLNSIVGSANFGKMVGYAPIPSSNAGCNTETLPTSTGNGFAGGAPYDPGTPANCLGATRAVIEGTAGLTYRVYSSPKFGRLQYQVQYSYLTREAWTGTGAAAGSTAAPKATNNMVFTGMRYYIP